MQNNDKDINKLNEAIRRAAEEKGKAFRPDYTKPAVNMPKETHTEPSNAVSPVMTDTISVASTSGIGKKVITVHSPSSSIAEQFRVVCTHIFSPEREGQVKSVVITSSSNEEGKSVLAANLAVVTAQYSGKPTLLIDCNLRKPSINGLMGIRSEKGIADLLSGIASIQDVTSQSDVKNLFIIPAGYHHGNPAELLSSQKMKDVLYELKSIYGKILIDTSAVIPYSDPRILSHICDGTVFAVKAGRTRREVVLRAENVLKSVGANILGYVLTGIEYHIPEYIHRHL
jgi:capsular exopolysaccharide synthesis family protein